MCLTITLTDISMFLRFVTFFFKISGKINRMWSDCRWETYKWYRVEKSDYKVTVFIYSITLKIPKLWLSNRKKTTWNSTWNMDNGCDVSLLSKTLISSNSQWLILVNTITG